VFIKVASEEHLFGEVYRSRYAFFSLRVNTCTGAHLIWLYRVKDWINSVRSAPPKKETKQALSHDPLYEAERLRIIYQLITNPTSEGGAGITPKSGEWAGVESLFPLHDHAGNKELLKKLTSTVFLQTEDLDEIRDKFGEKVSLFIAPYREGVVRTNISRSRFTSLSLRHTSDS
jgi:hypothetical protein